MNHTYYVYLPPALPTLSTSLSPLQVMEIQLQPQYFLDTMLVSHHWLLTAKYKMDRDPFQFLFFF